MILGAKDKLRKKRLSVAPGGWPGQVAWVARICTRGGGKTAPGARRKWLLVNRKMASDNGFFDFLDGFFNIIISIIYSRTRESLRRSERDRWMIFKPNAHHLAPPCNAGTI